MRQNFSFLINVIYCDIEVYSINTTIAGKEYLFYQIVAAYKEELEFIEKNTNMFNYKKLRRPHRLKISINIFLTIFISLQVKSERLIFQKAIYALLL